MATAIAPTPITKLPAGPIRHDLHFDRHVRTQQHFPVSAHAVAGGEFESTQIAWEDYQRMGTQNRKLNACRVGETPSWVMNDGVLRKVLVGYLELRAGSGWPRPASLPGTEAERLHRAQERLQRDCKRKVEILARLAKEYVALKKEGADAQRLQGLACEIENMDTVIRISENTAGLILRVVTLYYRQGLNSVEVGQEVSLKPPHVRQILWRMRKVAASLGYSTEIQRGWKGGKKREPKTENKSIVTPQAPVVFTPQPPAARTSRYLASIKTECFQKALAKSIAVRPNRTHCKAGHDLINPEAGHIHVGDLLRSGIRTCYTCWREKYQ